MVLSSPVIDNNGTAVRKKDDTNVTISCGFFLVNTKIATMDKNKASPTVWRYHKATAVVIPAERSKALLCPFTKFSIWKIVRTARLAAKALWLILEVNPKIMSQ